MGNKKVKQMIEAVYGYDGDFWDNYKIYLATEHRTEVDKGFYTHYKSLGMFSDYKA